MGIFKAFDGAGRYPTVGELLDLDKQERLDKMERMLSQRVANKDRAALRYLLASEDGRWFLMRFFERCHLISAANPSVAVDSEFFVWEGERRSGLATLNAVCSLGEEALAGKQLAEREYYAFQREQDRLRREAEEGDNEDA